MIALYISSIIISFLFFVSYLKKKEIKRNKVYIRGFPKFGFIHSLLHHHCEERPVCLKSGRAFRGFSSSLRRGLRIVGKVPSAARRAGFPELQFIAVGAASDCGICLRRPVRPPVRLRSGGDCERTQRLRSYTSSLRGGFLIAREVPPTR